MSTNTQSAHFNYTLSEWSGKEHQNYLDIIFKNNDIHVIYDIGANVGGTAYTFLKYASDNSKNIKKIYCFEPDIENMIFLKNKMKSDIDNNVIVCINKGIYYGKTTAKVYGAGFIENGKIHDNVGGYSIDECMEQIIKIRNNNGDRVFCAQVDEKMFELDTLENLSVDFLQPDFIKIDVEGAEKNIIMHSSLIKKAKYIILEWNHHDTCPHTFIKTYLPNFCIISITCDFLLKNIYI